MAYSKPALDRLGLSICGHHDKLLEIYCRTDQQFICQLCVMDEHRGHDTVAAEMCAEMKKKLERTKQEIADRRLTLKRKMLEVTKAIDSISDAAWEACDDFEQMCWEKIRSVERRRSEMREKVGEAGKAGVDWTNNHLRKLEREVSELRRREEKLNQLSLTEDPVQFLESFQALGDLPVFTDSYDGLDMLSEFVTARKNELKNMCDEERRELFGHWEENRLSKMPRMREIIPLRKYFLTKYKNSTVEVDPNTVAACLCLSDKNREISWGERDQAHPDHPDRFTLLHQALCKNSLTGIHYWEVEWDGGDVDLAVSYKGIKRKGSGKECGFGHNNLSWKLNCTSSGCKFWHNNLHRGRIPPVLSRRVGIHLDYKAGTLAFYSVSDTLTQLHQVRTTFTEPLYPGFSVDLGATLKICKM
ncbi:tripartite motif-containing protein 16-like [Epinephelus moara]|uniref:tripartite motif-containing protein 16-like n=1 Tax=Epinephelus moara TaxID=300413 RepID=UPI00214F4AC2|nr:tripartite motif-containing protein 16-like [Epinephelus moara]